MQTLSLTRNETVTLNLSPIIPSKNYTIWGLSHNLNPKKNKKIKDHTNWNFEPNMLTPTQDSKANSTPTLTAEK